MKKEIIEKYENFRTEMLTVLNGDENKNIGVVLFGYFMLQFSMDQNSKPEKEMLSSENNQTLRNIAQRLVFNIDKVYEDFNKFLKKSSKEGKDYYWNFVHPILQSFDIKSKEPDENDDIFLDMDDRSVNGYLSALIGMLVRVEHDGITYERMVEIFKNDSLEAFTYDCISPKQSYDWVRATWNLPSSDLGNFFNYAEKVNLDGDPEEKKVAMEMYDKMRDLMKEVVPLFAQGMLSGCKGKKQLEHFRYLVDVMINSEEHSEQLGNMFVMGVTFLGLMPENSKIKNKLNSYEKCTKFFDDFFKIMGGKALKDYYRTLDNNEKKVARACFLSGLFTALKSCEYSADGSGILGIHAGCAYE